MGSNKPKILISAPYLLMEFDHYRNIFTENNLKVDLAKVNERLEEAELLPIIHLYQGIICGDDQVSKKVLDKAKNLKVIVKWGTGIDSIDLEYAKKLNIPVYNTPGAFTEPVSDSVIAYMLAFARGIVTADKHMKNREWYKNPCFSLDEKTVGIIGLGNIGSAVARKLKGFGVKVYANDIREIDRDTLKELNTEMLPLSNLLQLSDLISVNCDLNQTSYHLLAEKEFKRIKPGSVLINTARGPIIEESYLISALQQGRISGAALDVFEHEPLSVNSPLRKMENVLLAAHNSNNSKKYWQKVHQNSIQLLLTALR